MRGWRGILLVGALLFIATATLTPGSHFPAGAIRPNFWCFACGADGGADITLNLALFLPLGVALSLLGVSPLRALLVGMLLSMAVECAQHFGWPPDRIANATDLLTNTAGAFIGALISWNRATWLRPSPRMARVLAVMGASTVCAFLMFTAWALSPDTAPDASKRPPSGFRLSRFSSTPGYGWYHGRVLDGTVGGQPFVHESDGPLMLSGTAPDRLTGIITVSGRDERAEFVPLLYVHDLSIANPELMLGQQGDDARMQVRLRGQRLRLPGPRMRLRGVFASQVSSDQTLTFSIAPKFWSISSLSVYGIRNSVLPISLSLGWTLLQTVVHVGDRIGVVVTGLWLLVMWLPIGYWSVFAEAGRPVVTVAAAGAVVALTLVLIPTTFGIARCSLPEWGGAIGGMAIGVFFAARQRARSAGTESSSFAH